MEVDELEIGDVGSKGDDLRFEFVKNDDDEYCLGELKVPGEVFDRLYAYQRDGVGWLWQLRGEMGSKKGGGILGDDMGLGKTIQVASFLEGLYCSGLVSKVLIVAPLSVIQHWSKSLLDWSRDVPHRVFHGSDRQRVVRELQMLSRPGIVLSTYGTVRSSWSDLAGVGEWDYIILDEGHCIKGHTTEIAKAVRQIPAAHRLLLTGTPLQNNLRELWSLFDFATHEELFGNSRTFIDTFEKPILRGHDKEASGWDRRKGTEAAEELRRRIKPHFLRREKTDDLDFSQNEGVDHSSEKSHMEIVTPGKVPSRISLPEKKDLVVWVKPAEIQITLYKGFLGSKEVSEVLARDRSALASLTVLKKICDHPWILTTRSFRLCGSEGHRASLGENAGPVQRANSPPHLQQFEEEELSGAAVVDDFNSALRTAANVELSLQNSAKLSLLMKLLVSHKEEGHQTLVFSRSTKMLDIIEAALMSRMNYDVSGFCRLDGSTPHQERQEIVNRFNDPSSTFFALLMSTGVGSLGLTVTRADRVIIYDPSWNPFVDAQAVDRAYRIGQTRNVLVYRMITCGTIEEKIYKKQVFKGGLAKTATQEERTRGFFSKTELSDVFTLHDTDQSGTRCMFEDIIRSSVENENVTKQLEPFQPHVSWVRGLDEVDDLTHNDLIFQVAPLAIQEAEEEMARQSLGPARNDGSSFGLGQINPWFQAASIWPFRSSSGNDLEQHPSLLDEQTPTQTPRRQRRFVWPSPSSGSSPNPTGGTSGQSRLSFSSADSRRWSAGTTTTPMRIDLDGPLANPDRRPTVEIDLTGEDSAEKENATSTGKSGPLQTINRSAIIGNSGGGASGSFRNRLLDKDGVFVIDDDEEMLSAASPLSQEESAQTAIPPTVASEVLRTIRAINPRKNLTESEINSYDKLLESAKRHEDKGDLKLALLDMFKMMDICDDDFNLQVRVLRLCKELNVLRPNDFSKDDEGVIVID
ncbi:hypothetical protein NDN08_002876 [Rhodosorus marinus]|uniref:DNA excision repair protein ERCC-6-like n=1 Tax=Rhodosorus marinus TaxID=101924 RepID=A0AAV8UZ01_9RHOD|nr:hypothetical protein NDN08_002876 [Rhodosorus marinus]